MSGGRLAGKNAGQAVKPVWTASTKLPGVTTALLVIACALCILWLIALTSMIGGNPTAINAVLGIPFGSVLGGSLLYIVTRP